MNLLIYNLFVLILINLYKLMKVWKKVYILIKLIIILKINLN